MPDAMLFAPGGLQDAGQSRHGRGDHWHRTMTISLNPENGNDK
jgi:hypothetical protein